MNSFLHLHLTLTVLWQRADVSIFIFMYIDLNNLSYYIYRHFYGIDVIFFYFRLCATNEAKRHGDIRACMFLGSLVSEIGSYRDGR